MHPLGRVIKAGIAMAAWATMALPPALLAQEAPAPPKLRLPADVASPERYRAELTVVPDQDTFNGTIEIDLRFAKPTTLLWLNAEKLTIKEASLRIGREKLAAVVLAAPQDFAGFVFPHPVGPGGATLRISYDGIIDRKGSAGIFQVKYGERWYVFTQFESTDARRAFPCFDEPGYKTPWQLTLHVPKDKVAISNTPSTSETDSAGGMKTLTFAETRPLPSYLVALSVGDLEFVDAGTAGQKHTPIRIVVPRGHGAEARYAAETTPAILNLLEEYFGIPYPYEKLDEVAVPLFPGGMENAGHVDYGASFMLAKPEEDTVSRQQTWISVAAHELAHQWFGDLVTTAWWDDIWLNEGFASWMGAKIEARYHPEWRTTIDDVNATQGAMENDALASARRVRQAIESRDDIENAFDTITYLKGAALLSMFESYMGPERFRQGVRRYLEKYSWKNTTSADFLSALAGGDSALTSAFSSFLDQPGVPLLTASLDCASSPPKLAVSQHRFLPLGSAGAASQLWKIPVCARYPAASGEARKCMLLDRASGELPLADAKGCPAWVEANPAAAGYYRVLYQGNLLEGLLVDGAQQLSSEEKVSLIGDVRALTGNGKIPVGRALALVPPLARDPDRHVFTKTMDISANLQDSLVPPELLPNYQRYLADLYDARARQLGWKSKPGESDDDRLLRWNVLEDVANQSNDAQLITEAKALVWAWLADRKVLDTDMVGEVVRTAARHGDRALFDRLREAAKQEKNELTRRRLLSALGLFPQPELAQEGFALVLTDEFDLRESEYILLWASREQRSRDLAFDFVRKNWDKIAARVPRSMFEFGAILPNVAEGYCDEQHRREVSDFFTGRSTVFPGGPRILAQQLEQIDLCIAYKKAQQPSVIEFLQHYQSPR